MFTVVFPGQGSQKKGMGSELFDRFPDLVSQADEILGYSIAELCVADPHERLVQTQYTQPALFVVGALSYLAYLEDNEIPDLLAGHSLGEYNALFAAGAFDFATGVTLVQKRGALMGQAHGGGMAAVMGFSVEKIRGVLDEQGADQVDIANDNSPSQVVISGPVDQLESVCQPMEDAGAMRCKLIPVSAAFHSRHMAAAANAFGVFLGDFSFKQPRVPVIANVSARPYRSAEEIPELLAAQIHKPVRWTDSMRYAMALGADNIKELGVGRVLTSLMRQIKRGTEPEDLPSLDGEVSHTSVAPEETPADVLGPVSLDIRPETLGSASFRNAYGIRYAYVAGAMYKGIAGNELVVRMGKAGLIGFLGTGGLSLDEIERELQAIQHGLKGDAAYGMNLLYNMDQPSVEEAQVAVFLRYGVRFIEAAAYLTATPALVWFRFKGAHFDQAGDPVIPHRVIAKVSRPEVAKWFLSPPAEKILNRLLSEGKLSETEVQVARRAPISADICLEADSGGHTDMGVAYTQFPAMKRLRDGLVRTHDYRETIHLGAAGGIGAPEAVAAAFTLGADFILTGSVNQCSVEAGTSDLVKDMLAGINIQDTEYAPAGDMFEMGAKVQVMKRGTFFPARANKLFELYRNHNDIDELTLATKSMLENKYFKRTFEDIWAETSAYYQRNRPEELAKAERNPKQKMALIFKWYFIHTNRLARRGDPSERVSFQVHCGPALGAFNQFLADTDAADWRKRHVDDIARLLMEGGARELKARILAFVVPAER